MRYLLTLALLVSAAAHSAPVPNLVLTCSDANAVGQNQNACDGIWAYETPTNALIVSAGSLGIWRRFDELIGADTVLVCTLPVEPGYYSSCRDASGARRTAFVRKDSIAGASVTVDQTGAVYNDPVTAAENAFSGDAWCGASHWPLRPCVMSIGDGVFILRELLVIPEGLVVAGAGKGATMLVAANGVETAVASLGNVRLSDLTIVNNQPTRGRTGITVGLYAGPPGGPSFTGGLAELHDVAIHVAGTAQQNRAVIKDVSLEIKNSEITAVGEQPIGIHGTIGVADRRDLTLERSRISAQTALDEPWLGEQQVTVRLLDSQLFGAVSFDKQNSMLEILRSTVVGDVTAKNDWTSLVITDSSIKGNVDTVGTGVSAVVTDTNVEGRVATSGRSSFDGLSLYSVQPPTLLTPGELVLRPGNVYPITIQRSYTSSEWIAVWAHRRSIQIELSFLEAPWALEFISGGSLDISSSVLAGGLTPDIRPVPRCTDTYGADYELLTASCQPQPPP
jgi:hypothetical protein